MRRPAWWYRLDPMVQSILVAMFYMWSLLIIWNS